MEPLSPELTVKKIIYTIIKYGISSGKLCDRILIYKKSIVRISRLYSEKDFTEDFFKSLVNIFNEENWLFGHYSEKIYYLLNKSVFSNKKHLIPIANYTSIEDKYIEYEYHSLFDYFITLVPEEVDDDEFGHDEDEN